MDNINFTGIRNIGAYMKPLPYAIPGTTRTHMIINLTDDFNGNDLKEFKEIAKKCEPVIGRCIFPNDSNFIHIMTSVVNGGKDLPDLAVNYIIIPVRRGTLSMFSYIAKLTRKIASMPDEKFDIRKDFKYGSYGDEYIFPGIRVSDMNPSKPSKTKEFLDEIYSPSNDREVAKVINKHIQARMEDYLL